MRDRQRAFNLLIERPGLSLEVSCSLAFRAARYITPCLIYFYLPLLALATLKPQAGISNIPAAPAAKPKEAPAAPAPPSKVSARAWKHRVQ